MNKNFVLIVAMFFLAINSTASATLYVSSASSTAAWPTNTILDSFQNATTNAYRDSTSATHALANGDTLKGMFMFTGGLTWTSGTLTWAGRGVVDNIFTIPSGGTLKLTSSSMHLGPNASLSTAGAFYIDAGTANGPTIFLEGSGVTLSQGCATSYLTIDGQGHKFTMATTASFNGPAGHSPFYPLKLCNMDLVLTGAQNQTNYGEQGVYIFNYTLTMENMTVRLGVGTGVADLCDDYANLIINGDVRIEGPGQRVQLATNITINANSRLYIGPGVTISKISTITMTDQTSILHLDGCTFYTGYQGISNLTRPGMTLTKGTLILEDKVQIHNKYYGGAANTSMADGNAFILGGSGSSNYMNVRVLSGAYVTVDGCMKYLQS